MLPDKKIFIVLAVFKPLALPRARRGHILDSGAALFFPKAGIFSIFEVVYIGFSLTRQKEVCTKKKRGRFAPQGP